MSGRKLIKRSVELTLAGECNSPTLNQKDYIRLVAVTLDIFQNQLSWYTTPRIETWEGIIPRYKYVPRSTELIRILGDDRKIIYDVLSYLFMFSRRAEDTKQVSQDLFSDTDGDALIQLLGLDGVTYRVITMLYSRMYQRPDTDQKS